MAVRRPNRLQRGFARAGQLRALLRRTGHTPVSRVIGRRGLVITGVPLAGVRAGAVVAVLG